MGLHLSPRCPECAVQLRIFIIGRGSVVKEMLFTLAYCPECGLAYDAWCNSMGKWNYDVEPHLRYNEMIMESAIKLCAPWDVLMGYNPK